MACRMIYQVNIILFDTSHLCLNLSYWHELQWKSLMGTFKAYFIFITVLLPLMAWGEAEDLPMTLLADVPKLIEHLQVDEKKAAHGDTAAQQRINARTRLDKGLGKTAFDKAAKKHSSFMCCDYPTYIRIQTHFLKRMLNTIGKTDAEKIRVFNETFHDISITRHNMIEGGLARYGKENVQSPEELIQFFGNPYHRLNDEVAFKPRYSDGSRKALNIQTSSALQFYIGFREAFREFDFEVPFYAVSPYEAESIATHQKGFKEFKRTKADFEGKIRQIEMKAIYGEISRDEAEKQGRLLQEQYKEKQKENMKQEWKTDGASYKTFFFLDLMTSADRKNQQEFLKMPNEDKLELVKSLTDKLEERMKRLDNVAVELIRSRQLNFKNRADQRFFMHLISSYYSDMPFEMKKNIMKALIERPDKDSALDIFKLMVLHSGPTIQKLLQVLGRMEGFSEELRKIFTQLEEDGLPIPWEIAGKKMAKPPTGYKWVGVKQETPFVGSMAQTYYAVVEDKNGQKFEVGTRIMKDGILETLRSEDPKLLEFARRVDQDKHIREAQLPLVGPILDDVKAMILKESDQVQTAKNQIAARAHMVAKRVLPKGITIEFDVPHTLPSDDPSVIHSTWLKGEKFDSIVEKYPELAKEIAVSIAAHWFEIALMTGRFFHADVHQGNLKILVVTPQHVKVGFLDFGMAGNLSQESRNAILKLGVAAQTSKSESLIAEYIWNLSVADKNTISKKQLIDDVKRKLAESPGVSAWLQWSMSKGIKLKPEISEFSRGLTTVGQLLEASKAPVLLKQITIDVMKRHKGDVAKSSMGMVLDRAAISCRQLVK